jgi:hypothetical protein
VGPAAAWPVGRRWPAGGGHRARPAGLGRRWPAAAGRRFAGGSAGERARGGRRRGEAARGRCEEKKMARREAPDRWKREGEINRGEKIGRI